MIDIPGYIITEKIHENNRIEVYRGYAINQDKPVIVKVLKESATSPIDVSRLLYELEIVRRLNVEGIIKPVKLERAGSIYALIMDDVGAISLREYIHGRKLSLSEFLDIAVELTRILSRIHQNNVIHRDIKPENIIINPRTKQVYIIDFSSAMLISSDNNKSTVAYNPVGSLEYMSPEQTGRLNIKVDQRSDLYSLGIVFYEMLTGVLPLQADDPVGWIYVHITKEPPAPEEYQSGHTGSSFRNNYEITE